MTNTILGVPLNPKPPYYSYSITAPPGYVTLEGGPTGYVRVPLKGSMRALRVILGFL